MTILPLAVAVAALLSVSAVAADAPVIMSKRALPPHAPSPIFIPASALFTSEGEFSPIVPEWWRGMHRQHSLQVEAARKRAGISAEASIPGRPCGGVYLGESDVESQAFRDSRETTIVNAKAIFLGTIERATPGLFHGSPGTLLHLGQLVRLKASPAFANVHDVVYVRHPYAQFKAGDVEYCRATQPGAYVPAIGDRVLVFAFGDPLDDQGLLIYSFEDDYFIETKGRVHVPRLLQVFAVGDDGVNAIVEEIKRTLDSRRGTTRERR